MNVNLTESLKKLRLSGMSGSLEVCLQEASANRLNHREFLELVLQDELAVRHDRTVERRIRSAAFRDQKALDDFDWDFNRSINKKAIYDLAAGGFVRKHQDFLLVGPPGAGKPQPTQYPAGHRGMRGGDYCYRPQTPAFRKDS